MKSDQSMEPPLKLKGEHTPTDLRYNMDITIIMQCKNVKLTT